MSGKITLRGCMSIGNAGHGFSIASDANFDGSDLYAESNGRDGIHVGTAGAGGDGIRVESSNSSMELQNSTSKIEEETVRQKRSFYGWRKSLGSFAFNVLCGIAASACFYAITQVV
ncbi:MAG: hypothetical protein OXR62_08235 [Ahrensia sp.]|nr:hypothetical protein [Ahrensia sp.]